jgi:hypothetical protein
LASEQPRTEAQVREFEKPVALDGENKCDMRPWDALAAAASCVGNGLPISYHAGPVITQPSKIYYIWYGDWTGNTAPSISTDFATNFGSSAYHSINTTYSVHPSVSYGGSAYDWYSRGRELSNGDVRAIVFDRILGGFLPVDENAVYFVMAAADVNNPGFCTDHCAWHYYGSYQFVWDIKYAFIGNPNYCVTVGRGGCYWQSTLSPNDNPAADAMLNMVTHELEESLSDPNISAWYDAAGCENEDKCAWTFGVQYPAANGSSANVRLGTRDYLIQQNWVNAGGGYCALSNCAPQCPPGTCDSQPDGCGGTIYCGDCPPSSCEPTKQDCGGYCCPIDAVCCSEGCCL